MKKLFYVLFSAVILAGCGGSESGSKDITGVDRDKLTQTVGADKTEGKSGVQFTTTGAWRSEIKSIGLRSGESTAGWLSIDPSSADRAGSYNINIMLELNTTGADRAATITIFSGTAKIVITVTQKATAIDDDDDDDDPVPVPVTKRLVARIEYGPTQFHAFRYDAQSRMTRSSYNWVHNDMPIEEWSTFTYSKNTIKETLGSTKTEDEHTVTHSLNSNGFVVNSINDGTTSIDYTYDQDNFIRTIRGTNEDGNPIEVDFNWGFGNLKSYILDKSQDPKYRQLVEYEYSAVENNVSNINLIHYLNLSNPMLDIIMFDGHGGRTSTHLISKITHQLGEETPLKFVEAFRYDIDSKGYITKIYSREESENEIYEFRLNCTVTYLD